MRCYLVKLCEKENILLAQHLRPVGLESAPSAAAPPAALAETWLNEANHSPPAGVRQDSLEAVLQHLDGHGTDAREATRGLKALASLCFAASSIGDALPEVLRLILSLSELHSCDGRVRFFAMKALCNLSFDSAVASKFSSNLRVMKTLLDVLAAPTPPGSREEAFYQASECVARLLVAEASDSKLAEGQRSAVLQDFFAELLAEWSPNMKSGAWHAMLKVVCQLIDGEVLLCPTVAASLSAARPHASHAGLKAQTAAVAWFTLVQDLLSAVEAAWKLRLLQDLLLGGLMEATVQLMAGSQSQEVLQAGLEMLFALLAADGNAGNAALQAFCAASTGEAVFDAMQSGTPAVQLAALRILDLSRAWHTLLMDRAGLRDESKLVEKVRTTMSQHIDHEKIQLLGLQVLAKTMEKVNIVQLIKEGGGEGLVKAVMTRHLHAKLVQTWGRIVLDGIGLDRHWQPRHVEAAAATSSETIG